MIEYTEYENDLYAITLRRDTDLKQGTNFYTPENSSLQLGTSKRDKGYSVDLHRHKTKPRKTENIRETLVVKDGEIEVGIFSKEYLIEKKILKKGDVILLLAGAHSIDFIQESELLIVKQGPYSRSNKENIRGRKKS